MKIVILDSGAVEQGDLSWDELEKDGELSIYGEMTTDSDETVRRIGNNEVAITNKTPITEEILSRCPGIKYIALLSTGYNVVDVKAAGERGIKVSNVPSYGTDTVAQYTMAMLLELCHHIGHHNSEVQNGEWRRRNTWFFSDFSHIELKGKTMGIIGFGKIGKRTAELSSAFGMDVLVHSRTVNPQYAEEGWKYVSLDTLLSSSDVISLHCPLTVGTKGMINAETIRKMKDGVFLLNTSRGGLVVEEDLRDALESGKVAGAAVDVVSTEPMDNDNPLLGAKNCIITPHMAWVTKEARGRIISETVRNVRSYRNGSPINVVN
ncbi:MAG: D-2-hydroxyacid dehydrogenase [Candidatus Ornithospirochaeta sp.]